MKTLLFLLVLAGVGVVWIRERIMAADLRAQIFLAREGNTEARSLARERARLQELQQQTEAQARRARAAIERAPAPAEPAAPQLPAPRPPPTVLTPGEWLPIAAWQNRGRATPTAAVETALWAAAGGDVATLRQLLQLDEPTRAKADSILARLPEASRAVYASAEHLIAAFTTKAIPLGDAQLVWQHEPGPDEAVACVFVKNPDAGIVPVVAPPAPAIPETREAALQRASRRIAEKTPPMAPPNQKTVATYLSLRRSDDGWRLIVPMAAVEKIAKELGGSR